MFFFSSTQRTIKKTMTSRKHDRWEYYIYTCEQEDDQNDIYSMQISILLHVIGSMPLYSIKTVLFVVFQLYYAPKLHFSHHTTEREHSSCVHNFIYAQTMRWGICISYSYSYYLPIKMITKHIVSTVWMLEDYKWMKQMRITYKVMHRILFTSSRNQFNIFNISTQFKIVENCLLYHVTIYFTVFFVPNEIQWFIPFELKQIGFLILSVLNIHSLSHTCRNWCIEMIQFLCKRIISYL